jgi:hypothetical protein
LHRADGAKSLKIKTAMWNGLMELRPQTAHNCAAFRREKQRTGKAKILLKNKNGDLEWIHWVAGCICTECVRFFIAFSSLRFEPPARANSSGPACGYPPLRQEEGARMGHGGALEVFALSSLLLSFWAGLGQLAASP